MITKFRFRIPCFGCLYAEPILPFLLVSYYTYYIAIMTFHVEDFLLRKRNVRIVLPETLKFAVKSARKPETRNTE